MKREREEATMYLPQPIQNPKAEAYILARENKAVRLEQGEVWLHYIKVIKGRKHA